jgi:hypothetical protein
MKPCSVVWTKEAINQLSPIWLRSPDRSSITKSVSTIDEVLVEVAAVSPKSDVAS